MSFYWADFKNVSNDVFRLDTRIFLSKVQKPSDSDVCVGAVVGKNPGSAKKSEARQGMQTIDLGGDKLLPTVRNVILKAYGEADRTPPPGAYIQVFNLFYLCDKNLGRAIEAFKVSSGPDQCGSEHKPIPWVWYVWGRAAKNLDSYKRRFLSLETNKHFFFDGKAKEFAHRMPDESDFARHTQGLKHAFVVPHIADVIALR